MTNMITNEKPSQYEIELLLPWHAAGTLNSRDAGEVERAMAQNRELARPFAMVRDEMNETILLNETLGAPSARAMENLFKTIDKERKGVRSRAASGLGWLKDMFTPRVLIYSASAAAVIMVPQVAVIAKLLLADRGGHATFETASSPPSATRGIDLGSHAVVRFAAQVNIADVTKYLDSRNASIVDGPRPDGMYRVRIARSHLAADELARPSRNSSPPAILSALRRRPNRGSAPWQRCGWSLRTGRIRGRQPGVEYAKETATGRRGRGDGFANSPTRRPRHSDRWYHPRATERRARDGQITHIPCRQ